METITPHRRLGCWAACLHGRVIVFGFAWIFI
ncbi:hypothetical protein Q3G72_002261 [Acer saccharum]|nr:hypothetical protein Q3G72_002261 [Acer saccharum]